MAQVEEFESLLKEVVQAKRLSASKMSKLTEIALKSMEEDTQLVSILYRTHKSLSSSGKVSSLYVFDALSRAAKHQANKQNLTGNINSPKGNSATFLLRVEGILEGLFRDMTSAGNPELKEKAKKVYDIWVKGNTFPSSILSQLLDIINGKENQAANKATTTDPRVAAQNKSNTTPPATKHPTPQPQPPPPQPTATPQTPPVPNAQSALLALLAQAANTNGTKPPEQTISASIPAVSQPQQQLGAPQLALLQQLAQLGNSASFPVPVSNPVPPVANDIDHGRSPSSRDEPHGSRIKDAQYDRYDSSDRRDYNSHHHDHVGNPRGGFRGGRGQRFRDNGSRSPLQRTRRSRSRSPPSRYGGRREIRPYSPPGRPTKGSTSSREPDEPQSNVDEFGREVRPEQAETPAETPATSSAQPTPNSQPSQPSSISPTHAASSPPPQTASATAASLDPPRNTTPVGMESFNLATFDFTSPAAWETLGNMWLVTNGTMPSAEQLMQFVMAASTGMNPAMFMQDWNQQSSDWQSDVPATQNFSNNRGTQYGRGGFQGGRGGGSQSYNNHTEAKVMAGGNGSDMAAFNSQGTGPGGGRMQKVGDRWMFVKGSDGTVVSS